MDGVTIGLMNYGVTYQGDGTWLAEGDVIDPPSGDVIFSFRGPQSFLIQHPDMGEGTESVVFSIGDAMMRDRFDALLNGISNLATPG